MGQACFHRRERGGGGGGEHPQPRSASAEGGRSERGNGNRELDGGGFSGIDAVHRASHFSLTVIGRSIDRKGGEFIGLRTTRERSSSSVRI